MSNPSGDSNQRPWYINTGGGIALGRVADKTVDYLKGKWEQFKQAATSELPEEAPPGKKYERMVKHVKKGYAKDGKLTKREKGIAYATAWKLYNQSKKKKS